MQPEPKIQWTVEKRRVSDLKEWEKNPRKITEDQYKALVEAIRARGFHDVIKVDLDGTIVSGHQRRRALIEIGVEDVPVVVPDRALTPDERDIIAIESNKHRGAFDWDILANQFEIDHLLAGGFSKDELDLSTFHSKVGDVDPDEVPSEVPVVAQPGDLFMLGRHRVLCGDSTSSENFERLMDGKKAQMVFTDPPYNVAYKGGPKAKRSSILNDKMGTDDFYTFLFSFLTQAIRYTAGAFYICMSSSELHTLHQAFVQGGGHWQTYILWAKDHFTLSRTDYQNQTEPILYGFSNELLEKMDHGEGDVIMYGWNEHEWYGGRKQGNVWHFPKPSRSKEHPTMKPVALCEKAIINSSLENEIVLDPFLGSGSTLIAAEKTNRICYGVELDPHYTDVIIARWEDFTGQKAVKVS